MKTFSGFSSRFVMLGKLAAVGVVLVGFLAIAGLRAISVADQGHYSPALARVTGPNGDSHTLSFRGVGCAISMCSRIRIQSKVENSPAVNNTWLDSVASISDITSQDALFTFRDGSAQRLPIISGNRFLYFANGKAEMGNFKSIEFISR